MEEKIKVYKKVAEQLRRSISSLENIKNAGFSSEWGTGFVEGLETGIRWYKTDVVLIEKIIKIWES